MEQLLPVVFTHLVAFLLFIWLLKKYALGPVLNLLDERREKIAAQFDKIAASEKRVATLKEEHEAKLRDIDAEARKRVTEEVNRARRIAEEITDKARADASEIVEKAKRSIQLESDRVRVELKDQTVAMILEATERLIRERLDDEKHRELVTSFVEEIDRRAN